MGIPMEAYPSRGVYVKEHDLLDRSVFLRLRKWVLEGLFVYIHFGLPCSRFSRLQNLSGGTRTADRPEGDGSRQNEVIGNQLADEVAELCWCLHSMGCYFSIENPASSLVWGYAPIESLLEIGFDVCFDQCEFGLVPPTLLEVTCP